MQMLNFIRYKHVTRLYPFLVSTCDRVCGISKGKIFLSKNCFCIFTVDHLCTLLRFVCCNTCTLLGFFFAAIAAFQKFWCYPVLEAISYSVCFAFLTSSITITCTPLDHQRTHASWNRTSKASPILVVWL